MIFSNNLRGSLRPHFFTRFTSLNPTYAKEVLDVFYLLECLVILCFMQKKIIHSPFR